jgi:hypothetical protein
MCHKASESQEAEIVAICAAEQILHGIISCHGQLFLYRVWKESDLIHAREPKDWCIVIQVLHRIEDASLECTAAVIIVGVGRNDVVKLVEPTFSVSAGIACETLEIHTPFIHLSDTWEQSKITFEQFRAWSPWIPQIVRKDRRGNCVDGAVPRLVESTV